MTPADTSALERLVTAGHYRQAAELLTVLGRPDVARPLSELAGACEALAEAPDDVVARRQRWQARSVVAAVFGLPEDALQ